MSLMNCVMHYGCPIFHFVLMAAFAHGIVLFFVCVAAIYFLVFWSGNPTNIFLFCCFLCGLRSIKTTRVSKFFEWLSRVDNNKKMMIILIMTGHFAGSVAVTW